METFWYIKLFKESDRQKIKMVEFKLSANDRYSILINVPYGFYELRQIFVNTVL